MANLPRIERRKISQARARAEEMHRVEQQREVAPADLPDSLHGAVQIA